MRTSVLLALPQPRHVASAAADRVAAHSALAGPVLSIEGARTYAPAISTGAVAGFVRFSAPTPRFAGGGRSPGTLLPPPSFLLTNLRFVFATCNNIFIDNYQ